KMRVRVISQTLTDLWRNRDMLNPFKSRFFAIELVSHKLLRYTVPLVLLALLGASAMLGRSSAFYFVGFIAQILFYLLGAVGLVLERSGRRLSVLAMPLYFALANLASVVAFYKFLRGETYTRWDPIRQER